MWRIFSWKSCPDNFHLKSSLEMCRQTFTTFSTLKFAVNKDMSASAHSGKNLA